MLWPESSLGGSGPVADTSEAARVGELARRTGATVVAEGIETDAELAALRRLGVGCGQGYLLGRPGTLEQALARVAAAAFPAGRVA